MEKFKEFEEAYGRRHDAYTRDYHSSISGMGKHQSAAYHADGGANDEGWDREHHHKPADHPHSVHINGKKWKTFGSHSHATNVARKIKGATVHRESTDMCNVCGQTPCNCTHINELSDTTLMSYAQKVHDDSQKHDKDPSKRSAAKRNKSVMGFSRALNKLEARPHKEETEMGDAAHATTMKHRILVTYSDPHHTASHMRKEKVQKHVLMPSSHKGESIYKAEAEELAKKHIKKQGYKVHEVEHVGLVTKKVHEEVERITELTSELLARYKEKAAAAASAADKAKKYDLGHKRFKGIIKATFKQFANDAKK
jgi:hypothetical protein